MNSHIIEDDRIQEALKDLLGGTIKEMVEAEMDDHPRYEKSERSDNDDYRNGYKRKRIHGDRSTSGPQINIQSSSGQKVSERYFRY